MVVVVLAVLLLLAVVVIVATAVLRLFAPVDRGRVERFAVRQDLEVTSGNGDLVICYLATTRRWRGGLLAIALLAYLCARIATRHGVGVDSLAGFAGWFVGAVIAEWRVDELARGPRMAAVLRVRRLTDYVGLRVVLLAAAMGSLGVALGAAAVVVGVLRSAGLPASSATLLAGLLVGAVIAAVIRRVVERPQPLTAGDLLAADDAIRGSSLHVLLGSTVAIGGYVAAVSVGQILPPGQTSAERAVNVFGYLLVPALGVVVARRSRRPVRSVRCAAAPADPGRRGSVR